MASLSPYISVTIQDSTNRQSTFQVHTQSTNGVDEFRGLARAVVKEVDDIIDGFVVAVGAYIPFTFANDFVNAPRTSVNAECDVEKIGRFIFEDQYGRKTQVSIPTIRDSVVDDVTNLIDTSNAQVNNFITAMTSNFIDNALNIVPVNVHDEPLVKTTSAYQTFAKARSKRSGSALLA